MASFAKLGPYQYQVLVRRKGYLRQTRTFDTRGEAAAWARDVESSMDGGTFRDRKVVAKATLHDALELYLNEVTVNKARNLAYPAAAGPPIGLAPLANPTSLRLCDLTRRFHERSWLKLALLYHLYCPGLNRWHD